MLTSFDSLWLQLHEIFGNAVGGLQNNLISRPFDMERRGVLKLKLRCDGLRDQVLVGNC